MCFLENGFLFVIKNPYFCYELSKQSVKLDYIRKLMHKNDGK